MKLPIKNFQRSWLAWLIICAVTFVIYSGTIRYGILYNNDDETYLTDSRITQLTTDHVKGYFSEYWLGMYQPLPVFSFAVVDHLFNHSVPAQRIIQILLHCLNILLVLVLVRKLSGNFWVGSLTALFFAIHPMHVESVTWLATRSNLVYSCFYLLALILYMKWQDDKRWWKWGLMFFCFLLSLFSKVTAATFPMAVILLDWFRRKEFNGKLLLSYLPLAGLSLVFILAGVRASGAFGHITVLGETYSGAERAAILLDALWLYLANAIVPVQQAVIYLYPWKEAGTIPASYYILGIIALVITMGLLVKAWMMRKSETGRMIIFWLLMFLVTISIVMPLKWSRTVLIADRYTYIPYIFLFGLIFSLAFQVMQKLPSLYRNIGIVFICVVAIMFSFLSWNRNKIWENPVAMYTDVIKKGRSGAEVSMGYYNRGNEYLRLKQIDNAISDYSKAIDINSGYADAYYNRGLAYYHQRSFSLAIDDFSNSISLKGDWADARVNRANAYREMGEYMKALDDLNYVVAIHHDKIAYFNRGILFYFKLNEPDLGCADWEESLALGFKPAGEALKKYCK